MRRERAPSWREAALRTSSGRRSGSAPRKSRARRRARPPHTLAASRKLLCGTLRRPKGPPPRNADLGGPPVWGRGPVSWMRSGVLMPRPAGHQTLWPWYKHPHRRFRGASLQLRRWTRRACGALRSGGHRRAHPPRTGRSRPVQRTRSCSALLHQRAEGWRWHLCAAAALRRGALDARPALERT